MAYEACFLFADGSPDVKYLKWVMSHLGQENHFPSQEQSQFLMYVRRYHGFPEDPHQKLSGGSPAKAM